VKEKIFLRQRAIVLCHNGGVLTSSFFEGALNFQIQHIGLPINRQAEKN
jgi:hypothetical protein